MRRARITALLTTLFVVAIYGPVSAGPLDPQFRNETVFFHCADETTKVGNLALVTDAPLPSWTTSAPAGSVQDGEGCATADINSGSTVEPQENLTDGVWKGTFTGNLNTLTIRAYLMASSSQVFGAPAPTPSSFGVRLTVDGEMLIDTSETGVEANSTSTNSGATEFYEISLKNLGIVEPNEDIDGDGIGDNPFGTEQHEITVSLDGWYIDTNALGSWVYDTTEVPAGIAFNPAQLRGTIVSR